MKLLRICRVKSFQTIHIEHRRGKTCPRYDTSLQAQLKTLASYENWVYKLGDRYSSSSVPLIVRFSKKTGFLVTWLNWMH